MIKDNKAITVTMLTVVVIVLSILGGVTIAVSINTGLIDIAQNSKKDFNEASIFQKIDGIYLSERNKYNSGLISLEEMFNNIRKEIKANEELKSNVKVIGELNNILIKINEENYIMNSETFVNIKNIETIEAGQYTGNSMKKYIDSQNAVAYIPAGFTVSNVKDEANGIDETTIKSGLVIYEGDNTEVTDLTTIKAQVNQFVWIPVNNINSMAVTKTGTDANGKQNYRGVLYNWDTDATGNTAYAYDGWSWREPANLTATYTLSSDKTVGDTTIVAGSYAYDSQEVFTLFGGGTYTATMYQEEFNKMAESVKEYKGFYIGRYETSKDNNLKAQSKSQKVSTVASTNAWYGLYALNKTYTNKANTLKSDMIWGCQYDTMLKWMLSNNITITSTEPIEGATKNTTGTTGKNELDKLNNIYDIIGCKHECTQEAMYNNNRVKRGASTTTNDSPVNRPMQRNIC